MALQQKVNVGPGAVKSSDGSLVELRGGDTGELVIQQLHGRYKEQMARGNIWSAANPAAQAISVALATTYTGLLLYNRPGSNKLLVPLKLKFALSVAPAAIATLGLIAGWAATGGVTAETTPLLTRSTLVGNTAPATAVALAAATIVTPVWFAHLVDGFTAAALPAPSPIVDMDGARGILPGGFIAVGALTAVTGLGFIDWEELSLS